MRVTSGSKMANYTSTEPVWSHNRPDKFGALLKRSTDIALLMGSVDHRSGQSEEDEKAQRWIDEMRRHRNDLDHRATRISRSGIVHGTDIDRHIVGRPALDPSGATAEQ